MASAALAASTLRAAAIQNSTVYDQPMLFETYAGFLGRTVTTGTAQEIAQALRERYRTDGYARPRCTVTDDGQRTGIVRIAVTETRISQVTVDGHPGPYRAQLDQLLRDLSGQSVLRPRQLQEALQRARALPGLDLDVSTRADGSNGDVILAVDARFEPLHGTLQVSNRGTRETGRHITQATLVRNGLFDGKGMLGLFGSTASNRSRYSGGGLFATLALGHNGASVRVQGAHTALDVPSGDARVQQTRDRLSLGYSRPLAPASDTRLSVGFEVDDLDARQDGVLTREDRLRSVVAGVAANWQRGATRHVLNADWELGLGAFGSRLDTFRGSDDGASNTFVIARLRHIALHRMSELWSVRTDLYAQHSPKILPSIKRFKVGGGRIGRGFEAAALSGDRGAGAKLELQRHLPALRARATAAHLYGFYDLGAVWRNDSPGRASGSSAGAGLSLRAPRLSGYVELAKPLTRADADGNSDASVFAQLSWRF